MTLERALFTAFAALAVIPAVLVVLNVRSAVNAALCLVLTMLGVAGLFILLHAELLGILQVLVYAGAIVVLFLFVVMLLNVTSGALGAERHIVMKLFGIGLLGLAGVKLASVLAAAAAPAAAIEPTFGTVAAISRVLYTDYILAVEASGVLLLAGIVAAMVLAKRELD
jgi:NADH-quinone oxidoreductase subunit J